MLLVTVVEFVMNVTRCVLPIVEKFIINLAAYEKVYAEVRGSLYRRHHAPSHLQCLLIPCVCFLFTTYMYMYEVVCMHVQ